MSGRHVSLEELVKLSNVDRSQCEQFLVALSDADILDVKHASAAPTTPKLVAVKAGTLSRHAAPEPGLLARIRNRLGLGRPR